MKIDVTWMQKHLNQPIIREYGDWYTIKQQSPTVYCVDGSRLSVQASGTHYCRPRNNNGPYTAVEIGYPCMIGGMPDEMRNKYEGGNSIYNYVPIEEVVALINAHGGVKGE